jgi:hypothetical protein
LLERNTVPSIRYEGGDDFDGIDTCMAGSERIRRKTRDTRARARRHAPPDRATRAEEFKCGHCRTFVGPPLAGGRHRNHCPLCLYSRHVDCRRPGDRLDECRSLMAPAGTWFRRNGEQVIVHRCLGCDVERHCRVAADDNLIACMRLPLLDRPAGPATSIETLEEASA